MKIKSLKKIFQTNDYENQAVPQDVRYSWWDLSSICIGFAASMATFMIGFSLGLQYSLQNIAVVLLVATIYLGGIDCISSIIAYRTGYSWPLASRHLFGWVGAFIPIFITAVIYSGWQGFNLTWAPDFASSVWGSPYLLLIVISGAVYSLSAYIGFNGLKWISKISVPIFIVAIGLLTINSIARVGWNQIANYTPANPASTTVIAAAIIGQWLVASITGSFDINRFAKDIRAALWSTIISHVFRAVLILCAFITAVAFKTSSLGFIFDEYGHLGAVIGFVVIFLLMWTTADNSAYSASLAFSNVFPALSKKQWVLVVMGFGTVMAMFGVMTHFVTWLNLIACVLPSIPGILVADYFILPFLGVKTSIRTGEKNTFKPASVITWVVTAVLGLYFYSVIELPYYPVWLMFIAVGFEVIISFVLHKFSRGTFEKYSTLGNDGVE